MKKFAYYLPQFHRIPENDRWWGEGFTEWTNVKKARPLFVGHNQPQIPLNDNYYILDNPEVLKWQADISSKFGIDGMIFYHYYFCGKKLLEKPAELLLSNKGIPMNFFFCWANHSWFKTWEGSKELLVEQKYGTENEWKEHFEYLLPFFKDDRYEKKDNKPLLMFFNSNFDCYVNMIEFFDRKCRENGFSGIIVLNRIMTERDFTKNDLNRCHVETINYIREPNYSKDEYMRQTNIIFRHNLLKKIYYRVVENPFYMKIQRLKVYDGEKLFKIMIGYCFNNGKNIIPGLFFEWDNTPRHENRGYIITPPSKQTFMQYMDSIKKADYIFINAWNEWCEGMMLEPTKEKGYKYLEWIKEWSDNNE